VKKRSSGASHRDLVWGSRRRGPVFLDVALAAPSGPDDDRRSSGPEPGEEPGAPSPWQTLAAWRVPLAAMLVVYVAALALFVGIVSVRGGPSVGDAYAVTRPAAALADGNLTEAAHDSVLPQPPGYALLSSPFVLVLRPLIGSATWCDARVPAATRVLLPFCAADQLATHRWYRSQAVLGILAWMVLALGCVRLLRVAGAGGGLGEVALVVVLAAMPATVAGIVETFHPQDLVCVGLVCAGMAEALRRRWGATGALFGGAFLCKQFALLALVAVVAAVPGWRARVRVVMPAAAVVACGIIPFASVDPTGTWNTLSAVNSGGLGKVTSGTVLGLTSLSESTKLLIARDGPVVLALVMALWARRRAGAMLLSPVGLLGLATASLAGRLVCEVWFSGYYLVAVSVGLLVLDLAARRPPVVSFAWIAATGVLVEQAGGIPTTAPAAALAFVAAVGAVVIGLRAVPAANSSSRPHSAPVAVRR
jgi:hypothetical protein